jgi:hypothetical protein
MEFLFLFLAWGVPIGAIIFVVVALAQILRALGDINVELIRIRQALEDQD